MQLNDEVVAEYQWRSSVDRFSESQKKFLNRYLRLHMYLKTLKLFAKVVSVPSFEEKWIVEFKEREKELKILAEALMNDLRVEALKESSSVNAPYLYALEVVKKEGELIGEICHFLAGETNAQGE
uniref:Uncharacterized protein n=1 Tax=Rhipiliopsis peltata TaxID=2320810 RepID=A0A386B1C3_9CHLO|nr:hypothetical protein [Rhipiliopsis peltata]AYC65499.1 hypothetical protein [Rhipiliopsis peltata]